MKTLTSNHLSNMIIISLSLGVCFALYTCSNNKIGTTTSRVRSVPHIEHNTRYFDADSLLAYDYDSRNIFSHKLSSL